jgi:aminoglycoside phosphotransferase (APT) family kinase protein
MEPETSGTWPVPPATGRRLAWGDAPEWLRDEVEARLDGRVAEAVTQPGGFSPGVATRLRLAGGRRAFVKAVGPEPNPDAPGIHRREARVMAVLPRSAPAPRLLWSLDRRGWVALAFEDVAGAQPALPWRPGELRRVLEMVAAMATAHTPVPAGIPLLGDHLQDSVTGWRDLAAARTAGDEDLAGLDPWAARHLDQLADLETGWPAATEGPTLLHSDLRADNLLLTPTRVVAVDWPWASVGAAWGGSAPAAPQRDHAGRPRPGADLRRPPVGRRCRPRGRNQRPGRLGRIPGRRVPTAASARPAHPSGVPARQGVVALEWLRRRTGWP